MHLWEGVDELLMYIHSSTWPLEIKTDSDGLKMRHNDRGIYLEEHFTPIVNPF